MSETNTDAHELLEAIKNSVESEQIVYLSVDCTADELRTLLTSGIDYPFDYGSCEIEDNKVDVWGVVLSFGTSGKLPTEEIDDDFILDGFRLIVQCKPQTTDTPELIFSFNHF